MRLTIVMTMTAAWAVLVAGVVIRADVGVGHASGEPRPTPSFNVLEYGAKGDDATDNTRAFSECLAAVVAAGGGRMEIPSGVYRGRNVVLRNLDIRTSDDPGIGGVDLQFALQCKLEDVFINTGVYNVRASRPTHGTAGLITPARDNAAWTVLRNVTVTGYHDGIVVNEHTDGDNIVVGGNFNGLSFVQAHHASRFGRVCSCRNTNTVSVAGAHGFSIAQLDVEQPGPGQTDPQNAWQATASDVHDPGNHGVADIAYWVVIGNVGARDVFIMKGGANIRARRIGAAGN